MLKPTHITSILRSLHWLKVNERNEYDLFSLTYKSRTANLTTYTISSLLSLHVEPAPHLLSSQLHHLYLPHYKSPTALLDRHHLTCDISSLLHSFHFLTTELFVWLPSTSFCSLSSWFTSLCAYHLITVITFAFTIYHSISLSFQT